MLVYAVYDGDQPAESFPLQQAHLIGANDIGVQGDVAFREGMIICEKRSAESASLVLLVDAGEHGRLMLPTCLLPDREEPYLLYLELARHRIKLFLVKLEDWMLFELPDDHPIIRQWAAARELFTQALCLERADPPRAQQLARESLIEAIAAGERLTFMHADSLLGKRLSNGNGPPPTLGCRVYQSQFAEPLAEIVSRDFDYISVPIRWREVEPEEGEYDWKKFDRWIEWAGKAKFPVMLGPIIDFRPLSVPEWLYIWEHDYDTLYDLLHEHIEAIVNRYRSSVSIWNIASSLHINESFTLAYDQLMDLTRMATGLVKSLHPAGRTLVEVTEPFGEYFSGHPRSVPPIVYAEMIAQSGFKLDLVGMNIQVGHHNRGQATRDFMQISSILDTLLFLEFPVIVTGIGAPSHRPQRGEAKAQAGDEARPQAGNEGAPSSSAPRQSIEAPDAAGYYREPWTPVRQAEWLRRALCIALSKPFVESAACHELFDHQWAELPGGGLISSMGRPKPALTAVADLHRDLRRRTLRCTVPEEREWVMNKPNAAK